MKRTLLTCLGFVLGCAGIPAATAEVSFHGFGQIVVGSTLDDDKTYAGLDYGAAPSFQPESLLALQAQASLTDRISATAQIVASGGEDNFKPEFAWAYASYQMGDHWLVKAGRQRAPFYRYSDFLQVGQAYPWIRPPTAVYNIPLRNIDGVSFSGSYELGEWDLQPQVVYGGYRGDLTADGMTSEVEIENYAIAILDASYQGWLTLRASYSRTQISIANPQIDQVLAGLRAQGYAAAAESIEVKDETAPFIGVGFEINHKNFLLSGEYVTYSIRDSFIGRTKGYYLTAGYHFGPFMPIVTYGHQDVGANTSALSQLPDDNPLFPAVAGIIQGPRVENGYYQVGARYDVSRNTAVKLDYTHVESGLDGVPGSDLVSAAFVFTF